MTSGDNRWQFWIDVGGTFTDCIACRPDGSLATHKLLSTGVYKGRLGRGSTRQTLVLAGRSQDPPGFFDGDRLRLFGDAGQAVATVRILAFDPQTQTADLAEPLSFTPAEGSFYEIDRDDEEAPVTGIRWLKGLRRGDPVGPAEVRLGTTRGTNALLEREGARTVFVTTAGFGDVLEIAYQNRPRLFSLAIRKPRPLYETAIEATERLDSEGNVLTPLDEAALRARLEHARAEGAEAVAIAFVHAHKNGVHEEQAARVAASLGFPQISVSSRVAPLQKIVTRGDTTVVDAYLTPVIKDYLTKLRAHLPKADLKLMTSAGGLVAADRFIGKDSILSGPAGGVVGAAHVAKTSGDSPVISFDMGGTSTDVSRYAGGFERRYEMELVEPERDAGVRIVAPMVSIETVAAGGGSECWFDGVRLRVGPHSAGADPGPACYGSGGPLTVTDCNLFLGRVLEDQFQFPLDQAAVKRRLEELLEQVNAQSPAPYSPESLASGFLAIAASNMAAPIKKISVARGYDVRDHALVSFGGAGAQHACDIAEELGITHVVQHPLASLLSAYGMGTADIRKTASQSLATTVPSGTDSTVATEDTIANAFKDLERQVTGELDAERLPAGTPQRIYRFLDLRYSDQDRTLTVAEPADGDWRRGFEDEHKRLYGFVFPERGIEARAARVELAAEPPKHEPESVAEKPYEPKPDRYAKTQFRGKRVHCPVFLRENLAPGANLEGPALVVEKTTTVVVPPGWHAGVKAAGHLRLSRSPEAAADAGRQDLTPTESDPVRLTLFNNQFASIAEQMGAVLQNTSLSVNVKERLDFSCAIFTPRGELVVNAPHIPVHLGSMGDTVRALIRDFRDNAGRSTMRPGDVFVTNDPYRGGSHLPDVTVVAPVFGGKGGGELLFFVGSRAHHAEIGGITPGSMPPFSRNLAEEGVLIRAFRLVEGNRASEDSLRDVLVSAAYPSRSPDDNLADIRAQIAAGERGRQLLMGMVETLGKDAVQAYMDHIRGAAASKMGQALREVPEGRYSFSDAMDDGTPIRVAIDIKPEGDTGRATVDFTGTGGPVKGNLNANAAIVRAAVLYCFRCLIAEDIPLNEGVFDPLDLHIPSPSILSPKPGDDPRTLAAVVGGNVETSQRVVDVILGALKLAAASQGTMNNLLFGRAASKSQPGFGYYETICGGSGAGPGFSGTSAVHTHMTNTRITDPEVLEERFPVRLRCFAIRTGSGGAGRWPGGDGVIREIEFLESAEVSLLSSRRSTEPFGLEGGSAGKRGQNRLIKAAPNSGEDTASDSELDGLAQVTVSPGDRIRIETPGGGGYGSAPFDNGT